MGIALYAGLAVALAGCADGSDGEPRASAPTFTATECAVPVVSLDPSTLRCGVVTVPEDRRAPGGRAIDLAVVVARSTSDAHASDPVVVLSGGPGDAMLDSYLQFLERVGAVSDLRSRRDVILFDQRGTGRSHPLDCPEFDRASIDLLMEPLTSVGDSDRLVAALRACHDRLVAGGEDLRAYTSAASAQDVRDVMRALGYEEWNVYGVSYGSRLAQTVLRDAPEGVRSVVLDSVVPVQDDFIASWGASFEHSLTRLFVICAADPACAAAFPDLAGDTTALVEHLNEDPLTVSAESPDTGERVTVIVTGDRLLLGLQQALYDTQLIPLIPLVIAQSARGDTSLLAAAAADIVTGPINATAMGYSVRCSEEVPFLTAETIDRGAGTHPDIRRVATDAIVRPDVEACAFWQAAPPSAREQEPVVSDVPVLVLAGELDPITPPSFSRAVADQLPRSHYAEFPGFGHGVLAAASPETADPPCGVRLVNAFLDDPTAPLDRTCLGAIPPIRFAGT